MGRQEKLELLEQKLRALIHEESRRIDSFLEDDFRGYMRAVEAFGIEDIVMDHLMAHPAPSAQELYHLIPPGCPPRDEGEED
ncbi:MAG: hypothetical protein HFF17_00030 [Oscillospiraceae bacterium]|nr:hypothetical protein [Oscillospiraceae bacterium]